MPTPGIINKDRACVVQRLFAGQNSQLAAWIAKMERRANRVSGNKVQAPLPLPTNFSFGAIGSSQQHQTLLDPMKPVHRDTEIANAMLKICDDVARNGYAHYEWTDEPADTSAALSALHSALSLTGSDSGVIRELGELSLLQDLTGTPKGRFPPYQSKTMSWHTDGYYNALADTVRCFTLHCVEPAASGGALLLMDDELLVLALLKEDIELLALLSHPAAMTLPQNKDELGHDRPDRTVAMISRQNDASLTLRFTTRSQNIHWRCSATQAAAETAAKLVEKNHQWHKRLRLQPGQGVITRNVLHTREAFQDAKDQAKRQMLRGRFRTLPTPLNTLNPSRYHSKGQHATRQ